MKREYNEVYGWMPDTVINHLSQTDRYLMFAEWLNRKPTPTGWLITAAVTKSLGEDFLEYIFRIAVETIEMDEGEVTREEIVNLVTAIFESFATDINILYSFVEHYQEERDEPQTPVEVFGTIQESVAEDGGKQPRDAKGRFVKKQKKTMDTKREKAIEILRSYGYNDPDKIIDYEGAIEIIIDLLNEE